MLIRTYKSENHWQHRDGSRKIHGCVCVCVLSQLVPTLVIKDCCGPLFLSIFSNQKKGGGCKYLIDPPLNIYDSFRQ